MVSWKGGGKVAMVKGMFNFMKIRDRKLEDAIESL